MSEIDIVITPLAKNQLDVCKRRGNRRGTLKLVDGEWTYHDSGVFKLSSGELYIIAKKLGELNILEDAE